MLKAFWPGVFFTLLLSPALVAQIRIVPKTGITVGTNSIETRSVGDLYQEKRGISLGLTAGAGINIPFSKESAYSLQPEFLFIQQGYSISYSGRMVDQIRHNNTRLSYVQLPLLLQMHHRPGKWDIYSLIGPSLGYGLHGKIKLRAEAGGQKKIIPFDLIFRKEPDDNPYDQVVYFNSESANRWDVAAQFGLGAGLPFGPGDLQLEARFGLGFVAFYKDEPSTFQKEQSQGKSRTLSVTVNYAISLGKN